MPRDVHLRVLLPGNRDHPGWLRVEVDGVPEREFHVLGRGSSTSENPNAQSVFKTWGNTPTGDYSGTTESTAKRNKRSYGHSGAVRLKALAGDALLAYFFGRDGLLIHGGDLGGRFGGYRATHGCLRLSNSDMKELIQLISGAGENAQAQMCEPIAIRVTIREWSRAKPSAAGS